jgi:16S rRNA (adenine1518-N6/adenine1519-N6)-dimethyltransferase
MTEWPESPAQVRALPLRARTEYLLRRFDLRPRKAVGQSFLINEGAARLIAQTAAEPGQPLVEVGGGLGALTVPLAESGLPLAVVEIDPAAAAALSWLMSDLAHVRVVREDFLKVGWEAMVGGEDGLSLWGGSPARLGSHVPIGGRAGSPPHAEGMGEGAVQARALQLTAVGNLPYGSAGAILQKLWAPESPCGRMVVMVQREVAGRLRAAPGSKAWGPLSVLAALHTEDREVVARLGPDSFWPAPRVESTALRLERRRRPAELRDYPAMQAAIRGAFGNRRKRLSNSLRLSLGLEAAVAEAVLRAAGVDGQRRGETLNLDELIRLANALHGTGHRSL